MIGDTTARSARVASDLQSAAFSEKATEERVFELAHACFQRKLVEEMNPVCEFSPPQLFEQFADCCSLLVHDQTKKHLLCTDEQFKRNQAREEADRIAHTIPFIFPSDDIPLDLNSSSKMRGEALVDAVAKNCPLEKIDEILKIGTITNRDLKRAIEAVLKNRQSDKEAVIRSLLHKRDLSEEDRNLIVDLLLKKRDLSPEELGQVLIAFVKKNNGNYLFLIDLFLTMINTVAFTNISPKDLGEAAVAAVESKQEAVLEMLLKNGKISFESWNKALKVANEKKFFRGREILQRNFDAISKEDLEKELIKAAENNQEAVIREILVKCDISPRVRADAALEAAKKGYLNVIKLLWNNGTFPKATREQIVFIAVEKNDKAFIKFLLDNRIISSEDLLQLVMDAVKNKQEPVLRMLLQFVASISSEELQPALIAAIKNQFSLEVIELLLQKGNISNTIFWSALDCAVENKQEELLRLLLEKHKIFGKLEEFIIHLLKNNQISSQEDLEQFILAAIENKRSDILGLLLRPGFIPKGTLCGAFLDAIDKKLSLEFFQLLLGRDSIHEKILSRAFLAAVNKQLPEEVIRLFLEKGKISPSDLGKALVKAAENGQNDVVQLLLMKGEISYEDWSAALKIAKKKKESFKVAEEKNKFFKAAKEKEEKKFEEVIRSLVQNISSLSEEARHPAGLTVLYHPPLKDFDFCLESVVAFIPVTAWEPAVLFAIEQGLPLEYIGLLLENSVKSGNTISEKALGQFVIAASGKKNGRRIIENLLSSYGDISKKDRERAFIAAAENGSVATLKLLEQKISIDIDVRLLAAIAAVKNDDYADRISLLLPDKTSVSLSEKAQILAHASIENSIEIAAELNRRFADRGWILWVLLALFFIRPVRQLFLRKESIYQLFKNLLKSVLGFEESAELANREIIASQRFQQIPT